MIYLPPGFQDQPETISRSSEEAWLQDALDFLHAWMGGAEAFEIQTSGSTGAPKTIRHARAHLMASARMTLEALRLPPGDFLLALPAHAIGGRMVMVRAMVANRGLWLAKPSGRPLADAPQGLAMTSMVPLQFLQSQDHLHKAAVILLGGAPLVQKVEISPEVRTRVYQTFGMTETISHIALKELHPHPEAAYKTLPGVEVSTVDGRLEVHAPALGVQHLETNDAVELVEGGFTWKGRLDFVINSGAKKVHPEQLEDRLQAYIHVPFYVTSDVHPTLGERVVLVLEGHAPIHAGWWADWAPWERPAKGYFVRELPQTAGGKLLRLPASRLQNLLGEEDLTICH